MMNPDVISEIHHALPLDCPARRMLAMSAKSAEKMLITDMNIAVKMEYIKICSLRLRAVDPVNAGSCAIIQFNIDLLDSMSQILRIAVMHRLNSPIISIVRDVQKNVHSQNIKVLRLIFDRVLNGKPFTVEFDSELWCEKYSQVALPMYG